MGLKEIVQAGDSARMLADAALAMNSIYNQYGPDYQELLKRLREYFGDSSKTLSNLSDQEVNEFFLANLGDAQAVADAQVILREWEKNIQGLEASVAVLPANNL
jgi:uncharacterized protein YqgQ